MRWRVLAADAVDRNPIDPAGGPEGVDFTDNAQNSIEQEVATKTWVDHTLDMLQRGASQQEVVAKLAHDGCPDPEGIYSRALEHEASQSNEFDPNEAGPEVPQEDPDFQLPPSGVATAAAKEAQMPGPDMSATPDPLDQYRYTYPAQPEQNMGMQGVDDLKLKLQEAEARGDMAMAQQLREQLRTQWQGYTGKVRVANFEGTFRGMELDNWDRLVVAVETPSGVQHLDGTKAEPVSEVSDDVSEIQQFIDSIPEVEPNDIGSVTARIEGLQRARSMILAALGKADDEEMLYLLKMRTATAGALQQLVTAGTPQDGGIVTASEREYLDGQTRYEQGAVVAANGSVGGFDSPDLDPVVAQMADEAVDFDVRKACREDAPIMVAELPEAMVRDSAAVSDLAEATVLEKTAGMGGEAQAELVRQFREAVEGHRAARAEQLGAAASARIASASETPDTNDGPAEGLFL